MNNNLVFLEIDNLENFMPTIKQAILDFCKQYPINFEKQRYKISIINETIDSLTSEQWYKVTQYKYFHFFGRIYLDNDVSENIIIRDQEYTFIGKKQKAFISLNGLKIKSSAFNANVIDFYVVPESTIENFDQSAWSML